MNVYFISASLNSLFKACRSFIPLLVILAVSNPGSAEDQDKISHVRSYKEAAEKYEKTGNYPKAASLLSRIAFIYWKNDQADDAFDYFNQCLAMNEKAGNIEGMASTYSNMALLSAEKKDYEHALRYIDQSIVLRKKEKDDAGLAADMLNKARIFKNQKKYKAAIKVAEEGLTVSKKVNDIVLMKNYYELLQECCEKNGHKAKSLEYFKAWNALQKQIEEKELAKKDFKTQRQLEELASLNEQDEQAILEKEIELQKQNETLKFTEDSLRETQKINQIKTAEIALLNIEKERKELAIKEKEIEIRHKDEQLKYEQTIRYMTLGMLAMTACFGLVVFKNYRRKVRDHVLLQKQSAEIETKGKLLSEAFEEISSKSHKITSSINYAKRIQEAMLPNQEHLKEHLPESFILFKPRDIVSGDFYWFQELSRPSGTETDFVITSIDCTGHGVPGAFMSMIGFNLLNEISGRGITESNEILEELHLGVRKALKQDTTENRDGMDMALCKIQTKERVVEFSGAKNPLYYIQNGELSHLKGDSNPIGGMQKEARRVFKKHIIPVEAPTTFYIFSDGYADQFGGEKGMKFMYSKFKELLLEIHSYPMDEQKKILDNTIEAWKGDQHKQIDDILVIGFRIG